MVASGVPQPNGNLHAYNIAKMALEIRRRMDNKRVPCLPDKRLLLRIGIHSGIGLFHFSLSIFDYLCQFL